MVTEIFFVFFYSSLMTRRLHRYYGAGYLHFITSSCYRRQALLGSAHRRKLFLEILEQVRCRYRFVVIGYVLMPEHFHLLISEPERGNPSIVMQVLKQNFARYLLAEWRKRQSLEQQCLWKEALDAWRWSSFRHYAYNERGPVLINEQQRLVMTSGTSDA